MALHGHTPRQRLSIRRKRRVGKALPSTASPVAQRRAFGRQSRIKRLAVGSRLAQKNGFRTKLRRKADQRTQKLVTGSSFGGRPLRKRVAGSIANRGRRKEDQPITRARKRFVDGSVRGRRAGRLLRS